MIEETTFRKSASMAECRSQAALTPVVAHGLAGRFSFSGRPNWISVSADRAVSLHISLQMPLRSLSDLLIPSDALPVNQRYCLRYLSGQRHRRSLFGSLFDGIRQWKKTKTVLDGLGRSTLILDGGTDQ